MRHRQSGSGSERGSSARRAYGPLLAAGVVLAVLGLAWAPRPAVAQAVDLQGVAVIDMERATKEAAAWASLNQQMQQRSAVFEEEIRQIQSRLQQEEQQLEGQRTLLSSDAFQEQVQAFQARVNEAQRGVNERKKLLDDAYRYGRQQIREAQRSIVLQLAQDRGYRLILNWERSDTMVIFADPALDITAEVVTLLNQRLPQVALPQQQ